MCLLSFFEGVLKDITNTFFEKLKIENRMKLQNIEECFKVLEHYDKNNLLKSVEKDRRIIKQAKKIRNMFVHENWMSIKNNVQDLKIRRELNKISIIDLINAITNVLKIIEMVGIENQVYKIKY